MEAQSNKLIEELRRKIRSLESERSMLEKKLKFKEILGEMRISSKFTEEEALHLKQEILEMHRQNQNLKQQLKRKDIGNKSLGRLELATLGEEIKTLKKMLKNEKKIHTADLGIHSNLQLVSANSQFSRLCKADFGG